MPQKNQGDGKFDEIKVSVLKALKPVSQDLDGKALSYEKYFRMVRTIEGKNLPPYFKCYLLLVDFLGYASFGKQEKVAWSVPIRVNGRDYLIEHRKLGLGIFAHRSNDYKEEDAKIIVKHLAKALVKAKPYLEWRASEAAKDSKLNVINHHSRLFDRYMFYLDKYKESTQEAKKNSGEVLITKEGNFTFYDSPEVSLRKEAEWFALSAIDSFFSWTEHVFIHISILNGNLKTGEDVANLADCDWGDKYKSAIGIASNTDRSFYDGMITIKKQLRNFMTHGAFGKQGEAFDFHSDIGSVPLNISGVGAKRKFSFDAVLAFNEIEVIDFIEKFIVYLWSDVRSPACIYLESGLPLILTLANDGTYTEAMLSCENMERLVGYYSRLFDNAMNMDW